MIVAPVAGSATWHGVGVETQTDGTFVLNPASPHKTSTIGKDDLLRQLVQPRIPGGTTPEGSALYSIDDVHSVVQINRRTIS